MFSDLRTAQAEAIQRNVSTYLQSACCVHCSTDKMHVLSRMWVKHTCCRKHVFGSEAFAFCAAQYSMLNYLLMLQYIRLFEVVKTQRWLAYPRVFASCGSIHIRLTGPTCVTHLHSTVTMCHDVITIRVDWQTFQSILPPTRLRGKGSPFGDLTMQR